MRMRGKVGGGGGGRGVVIRNSSRFRLQVGRE